MGWTRGVVVVFMGGALACGPGEDAEADAGGGTEAPAAAPAPAETFTDLEARLLGADEVHVAFDVTAEGAVEVALEGRLDLNADGSTELTATGTFAGRPVDVALRADGDGMRWGAAAAPAEGPPPPALREAILVGFTRMGILHNLARLTGNAPPDHAEGGVADWVVVDAFRPAAMDGSEHAVAFDITVAGEPSGSATLGVDAEGRPVERRQAVQFPQGEMRVAERYTAVEGVG